MGADCGSRGCSGRPKPLAGMLQADIPVLVGRRNFRSACPWPACYISILLEASPKSIYRDPGALHKTSHKPLRAASLQHPNDTISVCI